MNFGFSMVFFAVGLGGAGVQIVETCIFWEVLWWKHLHMKNIQNNNGKKQKKAKSSDPWARSGERPGRGHGSELFCFFLFFFSIVFCSLAKTSRTQKKQKKQKVQTHGQSLGYPHTNQKTRKTKNQETKKPKNQETKKPKNLKNKKNKKTKIAHPKGRGWVLGLVFLFFLCFLFFWFFGFLVCVWIAIADVPSRDCQALSVVALEARSIHYSTALFAMT